ncbi:MAG: hypothetical protein WBG92_00240 [Thiohalocapsa sp.]
MTSPEIDIAELVNEQMAVIPAGDAAKEALMFWPECASVLRKRFVASDEEIALWVYRDTLRAFQEEEVFASDLPASWSSILLPSGVDCRTCWVWHHGQMRFELHNNDTPAGDLLRHFAYSRAQIKRFDPTDADQTSGAFEFQRGVFGCSHNPSGRFLTHDQATDFLSRCPYGDDAEARQTLTHESRDGGALAPLHYMHGLLFSDDSRADAFEHALFCEAQILGIAAERFGASIEHYNEASRALAEQPARKTRTRVSTENRLDETIAAAMEHLRSKHGGEPSSTIVFRYLKKCGEDRADPTGIVVEAEGERLLWENHAGKLRSATQKTIANHMIAIRKRK